MLSILVLAICAAYCLAAGAATRMSSFADIRPDQIGEFVTVTGRVSAFHPPPEPMAPYAFSLKDDKGTQMRVVAWPDIYERVDNHELLQSTGTLVHVTAEVAEYKERLELHLQDWEEIDVQPQPAATDSQTTATSGTLETTATAARE